MAYSPSSAAIVKADVSILVTLGYDTHAVKASFNQFASVCDWSAVCDRSTLKRVWDLAAFNSYNYGGDSSAWMARSEVVDINTLPFPRPASAVVPVGGVHFSDMRMTNLAWTTDLASLEWKGATDEERKCNGSTRALAEMLEMGALFCAIGDRMDARAASPTSVVAVTNESVVEINCDAS
jgi:hypothetical protein